jgi:hypothetical protein
MLVVVVVLYITEALPAQVVLAVEQQVHPTLLFLLRRQLIQAADQAVPAIHQ